MKISWKAVAKTYRLVFLFVVTTGKMVWHWLDLITYSTRKKINPAEELYPDPITFRLLLTLRRQLSRWATVFYLLALFRQFLLYITLIFVYLLVFPGWYLSSSDPTLPPPDLSFKVATLPGRVFPALLLCAVVIFAVSYDCAKTVYSELFGKPESRQPFFGIRRTRARLTVALAGSYVLTTYLFAVLYGVLSRIDCHAFDPATRLYLFDAIYMSVTTATTIGSDVHPKSHIAKGIVMLQLLTCLTYAVIFFSVVAGAARESAPGKQT
jgi:hypothetical protein